MDYEYFSQRIHGVIMPSTGCTEPVAIALNTATARANARGEVRHLTITLDNYLYKNAMGVGIPGADERCGTLRGDGRDGRRRDGKDARA